MTNPAESVERIARGLTKAQREVLVRAEMDGNLGRYFSRFIGVAEGKALVKAQLATAVWSGIMLSARGLAVRQHLLEQEK